MKAFLSEQDKQHFKGKYYKFNMTGIMIGVVVLTIMIQPIFLDRENPNGFLSLVALLATVIAFSLVALVFMRTVRKSLLNGHLDEWYSEEELDSMLIEHVSGEVEYYIAVEWINDQYEAVKGILFFDRKKFVFVSKDSESIFQGDFPELEELVYKEVELNNIGKFIKDVPERLYIPRGDEVHVFVIPCGDKLIKYLQGHLDEEDDK